MPKIEVTLCSIMEYIGVRSRPLKEGEAVFKAGHIILYGIEGANPKNIKSLCLQTAGLTSQPHEITINLSSDVKAWKCVCSCKAGMFGFCKHIIATLIYINRIENLEVVSCTDLTQKWGKEKKGVEETYKAKPFKEFCHTIIKKNKSVFHTSAELNAKNFALLTTGVAQSALTKFVIRSLRSNLAGNLTTDNDNNFLIQVQSLLDLSVNSAFLTELSTQLSVSTYSLRPCCQDILNALSTSDPLHIATDYEQGSSMWARERQFRITGSTCYSIYTFNEVEGWENKSKKFFFPKSFTNKFLQHGKKYEKQALEVYKEAHQCTVVTPGLIVSKIFPWLGFSPDGVIFDNGVPSELLEIKCSYIGKDSPPEVFLESCDYIQKTSSGPTLKERHSYYGQVQLGMALLGLNSSKLILYSSHSKTFLEVTVKLNKSFAAELIKKVSNNYFQYMLHVYCLNKD